jgi:hypothetical protein
MTLLAIVTGLLLLYVCGLGPALILMNPKESPYRLVMAPALGLCAYITLAMFLAQFSLTGSTIAIIALPFFTGFALVGWLMSPLTRNECSRAAPALLLSMLAILIAGWPLIYRGMANYWGLANPDQAFLTPVLEWLHTHPIGIPPEYRPRFRNLGSYRDIPPNTVLAVFYFTSAISFLTRIPVELLFNVTGLCMASLAPYSVYALCGELRLPRNASITATAMVACSALVAYTFYLDSLAAVTLTAVLPICLLLAIQFVRVPGWRSAVCVVIVSVAMYYNYLGAIGLLGLLLGAIIAVGLLSRAVVWRQAVFLGLGVIALIVLLCAPYALTILKFFFQETFGTRFATQNNELFLSMALNLTERVIPFFWGLSIPGVQIIGSVVYPSIALLVGALFLLALVASSNRRISGLPVNFLISVSLAFLVILLYTQRGIGYGVFKLVAWVHPIMVICLCAATFGISNWLRMRRHQALAWLVLAVVPAYIVPNLCIAFALGRSTIFHTPGVVANMAPNLSFDDIRELKAAARRAGSGQIVAVLSNAVSNYWADSYLMGSHSHVFPTLELFEVDSAPRRSTDWPPQTGYLLHLNQPGMDIVRPPDCESVWLDRAFALSPMDRCRDVILIGQGWFAFEKQESAAMPWIRTFRWLKKRGEVLLLNASGAPQRLRMGMRIGPGNPSSSRTVSVLLNGRQIDQFTVVGTARVDSRPFVASGAWNQLEVEVKEDAKPLPRAFALWNKWIPGEPRALNLGFTDFHLVDANDPTDGLASSVDLVNDATGRWLMNGIYPDLWMGSDASITLSAPVTPAEIVVSGMAPGRVGLPFPFHLHTAVNGMPLPPCSIEHAGAFDVHCGIPREIRQALQAGTPLKIDLHSESTFSNIHGDSRRLSLRLARVLLGSDAETRPEALTNHYENLGVRGRGSR